MTGRFRINDVLWKLLSRVRAWTIPGGLVLLAAVVWVRLAPTPEALAQTATGFPHVVFVAGGLLAWRFHRSRVAAALVGVAIADRAFHLLGDERAQIALAAATVLLPATLAGLSLLRDRGVFTAAGAIQLAAVLVQPGLVALMLKMQADGAPDVLQAGLLTVGLDDVPPDLWTWLAGKKALIYTASIGLLTASAVRRQKAVEKALVWALLAVYLALNANPGTAISTVYFMTAGIILTLSVVETSYAMAFRDELTGLPSRRALPQILATLKSRYAIAMVDVDHFKRFNDQHGHDVGDQVLRMVASRLAASTGGGKAFRYGGEEFALVFPGKSRAEAIPHLEELRETIEYTAFTLRGRLRPRRKPDKLPRPRRRARGKQLTVTVSIGVAGRSARDSTPEKVIKAADKALYRAKDAGRNRVSK